MDMGHVPKILGKHPELYSNELQLLQNILITITTNYLDFNPFPHTAILQQTTIRKILNVLFAERNEHYLSWKALKTLWQRKK